MLVFTVNEALPAFSGMATQNVGKPRVQLNLVLVQVLVQLLCPQHLRDPDQLIVVVMPMEKGFFSEYHGSQHATKGPHVQAVVIHLVVDQEFRTFEIPRRYPHVIFLNKEKFHIQIVYPD